MNSKIDQLDNLKERREEFRTRIFVMMIEILYIFGLPAILSFVVGRKLDTYYSSGKKITLILLAFAFILSWVMVVIKYQKLKKTLKDLDDKERQIKTGQNIK